MTAFVISSQKAIRIISSISFLLLFPGFYFYQQFVAARMIPPVLGGFYLPICFFAIVLFSPFVKHLFFSLRRDYIYISLLVAFFLSFNISPIVYVLMYSTQLAEGVFLQHLSVNLTLLSLFLVGAGLNFDALWFRKLTIISSVAILFHLTYYVYATGTIEYIAARYYETDEVATHQAFARSALMVAFFLLALRGGWYRKLFIGSLGVAVLFILAARSEFIAFLFSAALLFLVRIGRGRGKLLGLLLGGFPLLVFLGIYSESLTDTRQAGVLNLTSDQSWVARINLMSDGLQRISDAPITGQFGGHFEGGSAGSYVHNILSAWDGYGFATFIFYFLLVSIPFFRSLFLAFGRKELTEFQNFMFYVSSSSLILVLGAKSIHWTVPALAWGLLLNPCSVQYKRA